VAEWLNAAVSKTVRRRLGASRVRIPPPPLIELDLRVWTIFSFANGKIARRQAFWTRAEVLEAAGLRE
jgi:hypothetical protein